MAHRLPLDRLKDLARSGLEIGKVAGSRATRAAAAGVTRAVETADALRSRGEPGDAAAATPPQRHSQPQAGPAAPSPPVPTPTDVAKVVERKPAAEKAAARKAPPKKATRKPATKAAPGAKLPPRRQADA